MSDIFNMGGETPTEPPNLEPTVNWPLPSDDGGYTLPPESMPPAEPPPRKQPSTVGVLTQAVLNVAGVAALFFGRIKLARLFMFYSIAIGITLIGLGVYFPFWLKQVIGAVRKPKGEKGGPDPIDALLAGSPSSVAERDVWWHDIVKRAPLISKSKLRAMVQANGAMIRSTMALIKTDLLPFDSRLRVPFLLVTMYSESRGRSWEVGAAGERGYWQIWKPFFREWQAKTQVSVDDFNQSPVLQAALMNAYLGAPNQFAANWRRALTSQPKSIILKLIGTIFPRLPASFDMMTACTIWKNGVDPQNKFTTMERMLDAFVRAASMLALANGFDDEAAISHAIGDSPLNQVTVAQADAEISSAMKKAA